MFAVKIETEPALSIGASRLLFEHPYKAASGGDPHYDISGDGQRFLMIDESLPDGDSSTSEGLVVVLNWFEELKRLVPVE
jgi:hypothetical protein